MTTLLPNHVIKRYPYFLNGFLPINKPKGISVDKILHAIRTDFRFVLQQCGSNANRYEINYGRYLEPFASGLVTFVIGKSNFNRRKFGIASYIDRATVELGVKRSHNSIDGIEIDRASYDHIDSELIKTKFTNYIGKYVLAKSRPTEFLTSRKVAEPKSQQEFYERIGLAKIPPSEPRLATRQKYPCMRPAREYTIHDIKLIDLNLPYLEFEISYQSPMSVRRFAAELAESLCTKGSLVELTRKEEGPMRIDDLRVAQLHETNLEQYYHNLASLRGFYLDYLANLNQDLPETYYNYVWI